MKTVYLFPPNYAAINRAFKVRGKPVIFCYGDTIYNPGRIKVPPQLLVHEAVHSRRQGADPAGWWERYIEDPQFRLEEEIPAHQAEFADLCDRGVATPEAWNAIVGRLASPLYGQLIDVVTARSLIAADGNAWQGRSAANAM